MLSWVFRYRARLQVVYGRVEAPPLVGKRFQDEPGPPEPLVETGRGPTRPGHLRWRSRGQLEIRPMPRRVA